MNQSQMLLQNIHIVQLVRIIMLIRLTPNLFEIKKFLKIRIKYKNNLQIKKVLQIFEKKLKEIPLLKDPSKNQSKSNKRIYQQKLQLLVFLKFVRNQLINLQMLLRFPKERTFQLRKQFKRLKKILILLISKIQFTLVFRRYAMKTLDLYQLNKD